MKKIYELFINTIKHVDAKSLLLAIRYKKINVFFIKIFLIFFLFNILVLFPAVFLCKLLIILIEFISLHIAILLILFFVDKFRIQSKEKIDKLILNTSASKTDFINFLKNDIYFNIKFSISVSLILILYTFLLYSFLIILPSGLKLNQYFLIVAFYSIFFTFSCFLAFIIFHLLKKDSKSFFSYVDSQKDTIKINIFAIIIFVILFTIIFIILKLSNLDIIYSTLISFFISLIMFIIMNIFLNKIGFNKLSNVNMLVKSIKEHFLNIKFDFDLMNFLKIFKSIKFIYPVIFSIIFYIIVTIISSSGFYHLGLKIRIIQTIIFAMFFTYPIVKIFNNDEIKNNIIKPFNFTKFILFIIFLLNSVSTIKLNYLKDKSILFQFSIFVNPLIDGINFFSNSIHEFLNFINIFLYFFIIPFSFFGIFYISKNLYGFFRFIGKTIDAKLRQKLTKQNPVIVFGDSLSLYPLVFDSFIKLIITLFLMIEIIPLAKFIFQIFTIFQISTVFQFKFLTEEKIIYFFRILFNLIILSFILKIIMQFVNSILSHFILFSDEIVYYENKIYKKTILRIPLYRINYIVIKQNILEKFFDIGTIYIETIDKNGFLQIKGVSSIKEKNILLMDKIKSAIQKI